MVIQAWLSIFLMLIACCRCDPTASSAGIDAVLGYFCETAYQDPTDRSWTYGGVCYNFQHLQHVSSGKGADGDIFISDELKWVVLAWRGTEITSLSDVSADTNIRKVPCILNGQSCGTVHGGFYDAYNSTLRLWNIPQYSQYQFFITGHSLGGALAVLSAVDLQLRGYNITGVATFGQPRVGLQDFINYFNSLNIPFTRYVKTYEGQVDYITVAPPNWPNMNGSVQLLCYDCRWSVDFFNLLSLHGITGYADVLRLMSNSGSACTPGLFNLTYTPIKFYYDWTVSLNNLTRGSIVKATLLSTDSDTVAACIFSSNQVYAYTRAPCNNITSAVLFGKSNAYIYPSTKSATLTKDDTYRLILQNYNSVESARVNYTYLVILPVPSEPRNLSFISATANSVAIKWDAPLTTGVPESITLYYVSYVTASGDTGNVTIPGNFNSYNYTGLSPHVWHSFTVTAFNGRYWSAPSISFTGFTLHPAPPNALSTTRNVTRFLHVVNITLVGYDDNSWYYFSSGEDCLGAMNGKRRLNDSTAQVYVMLPDGTYSTCYGYSDAQYDAEFTVQASVPAFTVGAITTSQNTMAPTNGIQTTQDGVVAGGSKLEVTKFFTLCTMISIFGMIQ
ncbi:hypothetical protein PROFUN_09109 [Planoprotostelium fungivorum]|uniref:Fibronectin type-III domain-containing protein n=1 Tax=Planoprotostelium fungivorum TaxID=1890364 RepID=A0A2P6NHX6_9EUKA|nr:hypothetical protein PROFUN_09109 [Planoprotostelium fungivorum]